MELLLKLTAAAAAKRVERIHEAATAVTAPKRLFFGLEMNARELAVALLCHGVSLESGGNISVVKNTAGELGQREQSRSAPGTAEGAFAVVLSVSLLSRSLARPTAAAAASALSIQSLSGPTATSILVTECSTSRTHGIYTTRVRQ